MMAGVDPHTMALADLAARIADLEQRLDRLTRILEQLVVPR
jgi:hypothetical protein